MSGDGIRYTRDNAELWGGVSGGTANAQTVCAPLGVTASNSAGTVIEFIAGLSNTGAGTLAYGGLATMPLVRDDTGAALSSGDLTKFMHYMVVSDGTNWRLIRADRLYVAAGVALAGGIVFSGHHLTY